MAQRRGGEPAERRSAGKAAAFLAGGLLLALLLYHAGIGPVLVRLRALGWGAPLVLVPYLVIAAFDALGWRCTLPATARAPLGAVYLARMAGEAVNSLTPTAVTGEPLKAHLLRAWGVSSADGVASIVIAKTALTVSQIFFILLGPAALFDRLDQEALAQPIRAVALVIPGGLGAQEVGGVALCRFLGIPEPAAVTLWLLKRARELAFDGVGLAYLARWTATRRARVEAG